MSRPLKRRTLALLQFDQFDPYLKCRASRWYKDRRYRMKQSGVMAVKKIIIIIIIRIDDFACPVFGHTNERSNLRTDYITLSNFAQLYEPALCNNMMKF